jgi:hypothetical protein
VSAKGGLFFGSAEAMRTALLAGAARPATAAVVEDPVDAMRR